MKKEFDDFYYRGKKYSLTKERFIYRDTSGSKSLLYVFYIKDIQKYVRLKVDRKLEFFKHDHRTMAEVFKRVELSDNSNPMMDLALIKENSSLKFSCQKELYSKRSLIIKYEKVLNSHWFNTKDTDRLNWNIGYKDLYDLYESEEV